jgi:hypothetical protein
VLEALVLLKIIQEERLPHLLPLGERWCMIQVWKFSEVRCVSKIMHQRYCMTDHGADVREFLPGSAAATHPDDPECSGFKTFGLVAAPGFVIASCSLAFVMRYYRRRLRHQGFRTFFARSLSPLPTTSSLPPSLPLYHILSFACAFSVSWSLYVCVCLSLSRAPLSRSLSLAVVVRFGPHT